MRCEYKIDMTKIMVRDRRYRATNFEGWKEVTSYIGKEMSPLYEVPAKIEGHWKTNKSPLGYATFRGLTKEEALCIVRLTKGMKAMLSINRWGHVSGYKLHIKSSIKI